MNDSMIGPPWLAGILGVLMLAAAGYAAARILVAWRTRAQNDFAVDAHHVLMGVSMAGMLVPELRIVTTGPSTTIWIIVWILVTVWFAITVFRPRGTRWIARHHVPHLVMSASMIYMLAAPIGMDPSGIRSSMSMGASTGLVAWPIIR